MNNIYVGPYKGFYGTAKYYDDIKCYHGDVDNIKPDVVTFVGTEETIEKEFQISIDVYLDMKK